MFNPDARPAAATFAPLNLQSELEALARNLSDPGRIRVEAASPGPPPVIPGDHFQIGFALETFLIAMLRYAPEEEPVTASVSVAGHEVEVRLRGYLDAGMPAQQSDAPWCRAMPTWLAKPLITNSLQTTTDRGSGRWGMTGGRKSNCDFRYRNNHDEESLACYRRRSAASRAGDALGAPEEDLSVMPCRRRPGFKRLIDFVPTSSSSLWLLRATPSRGRRLRRIGILQSRNRRLGGPNRDHHAITHPRSRQ
jgi:hypothetical protein